MQKLQYIDTHCHVHFEAYIDDMLEVVERNLAAGVGMITIGTQSTTSKNGLELAEKYDGIWATIGLHPNHVHKQEFFDANELPAELEVKDAGHIKTRSEHFDEAYYAELVSHPKVVAIGECGLDYYRLPEGADPEVVKAEQKVELRKQLLFASKYHKPVVIHCRDAHTDQYEIMKEIIDAGELQERGIIHSFTGTLEEAQKYIELGFYIAFNGILTFNKDLQKVAYHLPLEKILLETDSPYLTPAPNRGKRNEPQNVKYIAELLATIHGVTIEKIAEQTSLNAAAAFKLSL